MNHIPAEITSELENNLRKISSAYFSQWFQAVNGKTLFICIKLFEKLWVLSIAFFQTKSIENLEFFSFQPRKAHSFPSLALSFVFFCLPQKENLDYYLSSHLPFNNNMPRTRNNMNKNENYWWTTILISPYIYLKVFFIQTKVN